MKCPKCQTKNPDDAQFCGVCGESLKTEVVCPYCGHANPPAFTFCNKCGKSLSSEKATSPAAVLPSPIPTFFVGDRYQVKRKLGEGGKKKVYLVHDTILDRDVAFALIKTENIDENALKRVTREAKAMGKLGDHPNIVSIFDMGELDGQPFIVQPYVPNDVEGLIEKAPDHKLPLDQTIKIAKDICQGLEFAHSKGIVHRDIKPGNVLVNEEGKARITDFGLALMINVSRLTHDSMMVGTFFYMPPEQAMGGEVTSKADLYSLGAMMYEMVTGRPPFVGDDYVAIIRQHIDTPPLSPTWHRVDLPPAFESLIMLLLEKDPQKRPASAKDVYKALESIEKGDIKEPTVETQNRTESPLYRRIFVGRENELKQLQSAFDSAILGQGALMMVVGEPGIGKTAICEQLSTFVTIRGGKTLWGHCYEEGSLSLPYLAFVEAMRSYVLDREPEDLKKELGSGATDVARIVSEVREKLKVTPRKAENPEEDRYRLMQAVMSFLSNAATVKPMLVILEDLHDADKSTLEMLSYISRNLSNTRLLIIGTYRDIEVDRNHPLSAALAELRRVSSFNRVLLRGLNIDEVRRMLAGITQEEVPIGLAEAVHRQTEGNPLFIQEVIRYLVEEGVLTRKDGRWRPATDSTLDINIPEGLRDVIGKRLTLLSPKCNEMLTVASVIGREFRLDVLQKVIGLSDEELFVLLDEAKKAAVIEERATVGSVVTYRFAHAFFRQTLYEETIAPRRIRLHLQIGKALEEIYEKRLEEHAAELAEHFSHSSESADLKKAVEYGEMAAKRATDVYAYGDAIRLLNQALNVQKVLDPDDKVKQCDLLLDLGQAFIFSGEHQHTIDIEVPAALSLAESIGDSRRISQVYLLAIRSLFWKGYGETLSTAEAMAWIEKADHYALPDTTERAWIDFWLGYSKCVRGDQNGIKLLERALSQARNSGDRELMGYSIIQWSAFGLTPWSAKKAFEIISDDKAAMNIDEYEAAVFFCALSCGKRQTTEVAIERMMISGKRKRNIQRINLAKVAEAVLSFMDGRLEYAIEMLEETLTNLEGTDYKEGVSQHAMWAGLRPILYLGYKNHIESLLWKTIQEILSVKSHVRPPLYQAYIGLHDEVTEHLDSMLESRPNIVSTDDLTPVWQDVAYLEAAVMVGHKKAADLILQRFKENTLSIAAFFWTTCIALQLGKASAFLGKYDEAREYYKEAIRVCTETRFCTDLALTHLHLAELMLEHFPTEKKEALEHLDFAIKEFREMKMQPSLERALRHKDILKA